MSTVGTKISSFKAWVRWALGLAAFTGVIAFAPGWHMNPLKTFGAIHSKDSLILTVSAAEPQPAFPTRVPCPTWAAPSAGSTPIP